MQQIIIVKISCINKNILQDPTFFPQNNMKNHTTKISGELLYLVR